MEDREERVYYDEDTAKKFAEVNGACCENCYDVTFEKTWPAHTAYFACLNLNCKCHKKDS